MKRMKRMKLPTATLPLDLCTEILSRLPTKPLVRFRCVSKLWISIIDDSNFVSNHLTNSQNNREKSRLLVVEPPPKIPPNVDDGKQKCTIRRDETFRKICSLGLEFSRYGHYQVVGYINGVVCMKKYTSEIQVCGIFLWNPSIRKLMELPLPRLAKLGSMNADVDLAFGFDPSRNDFKVIASLYAAGKFHVPFFNELYTLSTGCWRDIKFWSGPCHWCNALPKAFLNGVTYWTGYELMSSSHSPKGYYTHFISFDASNDVFNHIELPDCEDINAREYQRFPVILHQSIALMEIFRTHSYIWVMDELGMTKSWTKQYSLNLELCHKFLYLKTDGKLLYTGAQEGVKCYNIENQDTTVLAKSYKFTRVFIDVYLESLALLNQST